VHGGAFLTFFELVKEVGASRATVVTYFNTAIAVVLGIVALHEPLTVAFSWVSPSSSLVASLRRAVQRANVTYDVEYCAETLTVPSTVNQIDPGSLTRVTSSSRSIDE